MNNPLSPVDSGLFALTGIDVTAIALSGRAGIDQAALSRLETGSHGNPTLDTLYRIAFALGKEIVRVLHDAPVGVPSEKQERAGV